MRQAAHLYNVRQFRINLIPPTICVVVPSNQMNAAIKLGKVFFTSMREFQTFDNIGKFDKEILIIHGDKDTIVSMSYVERAQKHYKNAELVVLKGEGHGFSPQAGKIARERVFEFLKEQ